MAKIAFIGLGNMGGPMAVNLVKAGHDVTVFDLVETSVQTAVSEGATAAGSAGEAASNAEVIVTMLPAGKHVRSVYTDQGSILDSAPNGSLCIDSSTIDVGTARDVIGVAEQRGKLMVDAPVSGGVAAAQGGTLTFMVGGSDSAFAKAKPILDVMGKNIFHAGDAGAGQAAKICNNMLLGISMIGTCEAFALADKLGLDRQKLFDISSTASGQCWSLTSYCPVPGPVEASPANRDYQPGFAVDMMLKDLRLAQDAAQTSGAVTPLGAQAAAIYSLFSANGHGGLDFSGIIKMLQGDI